MTARSGMDAADIVGDSDQRGRRRLPATAFRSRRSALSDAQRATWERRWPELGMSEVVGPDHQPILKAPLDTDGWFGRRAPLVLEIGCGSGTSTLAMAKEEPGIDVIAVEIYRRGLAQLLCGIDRDQVRNIRLIRGNALDVLQHLIAPCSLSGVRVFFPDPWPKARHHKRRLLQPVTIEMIADRLVPGGVLHAARTTPVMPSRSPKWATPNPDSSASTAATNPSRSRSFAQPPSTRRKLKQRAVRSPK